MPLRQLGPSWQCDLLAGGIGQHAALLLGELSGRRQFLSVCTIASLLLFQSGQRGHSKRPGSWQAGQGGFNVHLVQCRAVPFLAFTLGMGRRLGALAPSKLPKRRDAHVAPSLCSATACTLASCTAVLGRGYCCLAVMPPHSLTAV
jgi:hypothetical protein